MACGVPPRLTITAIPPAAMGGSIRTATIAGRVEGARSGDRVVLFAKSGGQWYVQPLRTRPFTTIDAQGRWRSTIHLGTEYAAILVREGFQPPASTKELPSVGAGALAIERHGQRQPCGWNGAGEAAAVQRLRLGGAPAPERPRWSERVQRGERQGRTGRRAPLDVDAA